MIVRIVEFLSARIDMLASALLAQHCRRLEALNRDLEDASLQAERYSFDRSVSEEFHKMRMEIARLKRENNDLLSEEHSILMGDENYRKSVVWQRLMADRDRLAMELNDLQREFADYRAKGRGPFSVERKDD